MYRNDLLYKYLRSEKKFPHLWCPGCGDGILLGALIRAIDKMQLDKDDVVVVSGIGCSGRLPVYVDFNTLHTTHGRALAFATGIKFANPKLKVIVVMGDGDATAIGGNHFIHMARRNFDITAIVINNNIYGMTGGQYSPTTPMDAKSATSLYGNIERPFDICDLAISAGTAWVARGSVYHVPMLDNLIVEGVQKKGFSLVEVMAYCHTTYGRRNKLGDPRRMMRWMKDNCVKTEKFREMNPDEREGKIEIGVLADRNFPEYCEKYSQVMKMAGYEGEER
ncbi:MAG TPA: 2-oxoacid:ferredoxin oxidoreductase subunit beta [bacterium]|nr:2-oxoacid:ferredoxin oxidoreductase subunit beta [bacterium]